MCLQQLPNTEPEPTLYCRNCRKIVTKDEAAIYCYGGGHQIDESREDFTLESA